MERTVEQSFANSFDIQLFRLMESAHNFACDGDETWKGIERTISDMRSTVRAMMHPEDLRGTQ